MNDLEMAEQWVDTELENMAAFAHGDARGLWRIRVPGLLAIKRVLINKRQTLGLGELLASASQPIEYTPKPIPSVFSEMNAH